jgi:hypothetical protein
MKGEHVSGRVNKGMWLLYICLHLILVTLSGFYIRTADWMPGKSIIDFYKRASGSDSSYGFFAPAIGMKALALFDVTDQNGTKITNVRLVPESEREVELRVTGIFDGFNGQEGQRERIRKPLATSLAAAIFSKYTDAVEVVLRINELSPITMDQYRQGQQGTWSELYTARFARNQKGGTP